ncbi:hypothetical protein GOB57_24870 [Sinorhizobium meliloti]|nr:hypothetical protein [Sinorhizobium meliloti]
MKPGIREDDVLIDVWEACARFDRPQDVFRTMLRRGMVAMVESGDMPKAVIDACGLDSIVDSIVERRRRKAVRSRQETPEPYQQPYPAQPPYVPSYAPPPPYAPYPPRGYAPQPDPAQWGHGNGSGQARMQDQGDERGTPAPARATSEPSRIPEVDRRALEEKVPVDPPRPAEPTIPEKRAEPAPKPPTAAPAAKKRIGELM